MIGKSAVDEAGLTVKLESLQAWSDRVRANCVAHEKEMAAQRQHEWELGIQRDAEALAAARAKYEDAVRSEAAALMAEKHAVEEAKKQTIREECHRIVGEISDIVVNVARFRANADGISPTSELIEWKQQFGSGTPIQSGTPPQSEALPPPIGVEEVELSRYLEAAAEWSDGPLLLASTSVSVVLAELQKIAGKPVGQEQRSPVPHVPFGIAIVGKRQSGKSRICKEIASEFGLAVITAPDSKMPDKERVKIVADHICAATRGWVLDGFPETTK
jgi:hypothetical protein